jgi:hypothetical protein
MMVSRGDRGRIERIRLSNRITFNGYQIFEALIEIDHINRGLDEKTGQLRKKSRTNFSMREIERFIALLDGEDIAPVRRKGSRSRFVIKINCPIRRIHFDRIFIMIFEHDSKNSKELYTITIYPDGKS